MSKDEALTLALEALEEPLAPTKRLKAITAIKEALAQEKALQALHDENERLGLYKDAYAQPEPFGFAVMQKPWVGLTPDEIRGISLASGESLFSAIMFTHDKLKEKNNGTRSR